MVVPLPFYQDLEHDEVGIGEDMLLESSLGGSDSAST
jgi:hypothetical protein